MFDLYGLKINKMIPGDSQGALQRAPDMLYSSSSTMRCGIPLILVKTIQAQFALRFFPCLQQMTNIFM